MQWHTAMCFSCSLTRPSLLSVDFHWPLVFCRPLSLFRSSLPPSLFPHCMASLFLQKANYFFIPWLAVGRAAALDPEAGVQLTPIASVIFQHRQVSRDVPSVRDTEGERAKKLCWTLQPAPQAAPFLSHTVHTHTRCPPAQGGLVARQAVPCSCQVKKLLTTVEKSRSWRGSEPSGTDCCGTSRLS